MIFKYQTGYRSTTTSKTLSGEGINMDFFQLFQLNVVVALTCFAYIAPVLCYRLYYHMAIPVQWFSPSLIALLWRCTVIQGILTLLSYKRKRSKQSADSVKLPLLYFFFLHSEGLRFPSKIASLCDSESSNTTQCILLPIHYSELSPIHMQRFEVNWAASLWNCWALSTQASERIASYSGQAAEESQIVIKFAREFHSRNIIQRKTWNFLWILFNYAP